MAPGQGFEPRPAGPKPAVLPLDDPGIYFHHTISKSPKQPISRVWFWQHLSKRLDSWTSNRADRDDELSPPDLHQTGFTSSICHHTKACALTARFHHCRPCGLGCVISVALSLPLRAVAVSDCPALRCPDFPPHTIYSMKWLPRLLKASPLYPIFLGLSIPPNLFHPTS